MTVHLCLSCRHAKWYRKNSRLTGIGHCEAPDPELPNLPATKWWSRMWGTFLIHVRGGDLNRRPENPVKQCFYYDRAKP